MNPVRFLLPALILAVAPGCFADDDTDIELVKISPRVWVHTSYAVVGGFRTDSHGLAVDTGEGIVLVDTCWNDAQTQVLLDRIKRDLSKPVKLAVITHVHVDRIGGIRVLLRNKIKVVSTPLTAKKALVAGYPAPAAELKPDFTSLDFPGLKLEVYFPGPGHTKDNVTVSVPVDRVLFGGCLIKSLASKNLGNTADAVVGEWAASVQKLTDKYPNAETVVPGHGAWGGRELLAHTLKLAAPK